MTLFVTWSRELGLMGQESIVQITRTADPELAPVGILRKLMPW